MAEIDVEALRGAIAALRAAVANNDTEPCQQCALSTIPDQDALICAVGGCYRLPLKLDERGPVRALLPLLDGLPDVLAALERVGLAAGELRWHLAGNATCVYYDSGAVLRLWEALDGRHT